MVQALEENRRIAHNLRPSDLDELGLPDACRNYCEDVRIRSNLAFSFVFNGLQKRLSPDTELHLFRILQEALTNIEKHAKAKSVFVELSIQSDSVLLRVKDDGCGSDFQHTGKRDQKSGMGLANMKERVLLIGGTFDVSSSPNNGVTITVAAPRIFTAGLKESSNC
jgi:signal transduction histidine kinase